MNFVACNVYYKFMCFWMRYTTALGKNANVGLLLGWKESEEELIIGWRLDKSLHEGHLDSAIAKENLSILDNTQRMTRTGCSTVKVPFKQTTNIISKIILGYTPKKSECWDIKTKITKITHCLEWKYLYIIVVSTFRNSFSVAQDFAER